MSRIAKTIQEVVGEYMYEPMTDETLNEIEYVIARMLYNDEIKVKVEARTSIVGGVNVNLTFNTPEEQTMFYLKWM